jgi:hypothetical protein
MVTKGGEMNNRILISAMLVLLLSACGRDEPVAQQETAFVGKLGDSYEGMLDDASQAAKDASENMQRTDKAVRERDR